MGGRRSSMKPLLDLGVSSPKGVGNHQPLLGGAMRKVGDEGGTPATPSGAGHGDPANGIAHATSINSTDVSVRATYDVWFQSPATRTRYLPAVATPVASQWN